MPLEVGPKHDAYGGYSGARIISVSERATRSLSPPLHHVTLWKLRRYFDETFSQATACPVIYDYLAIVACRTAQFDVASERSRKAQLFFLARGLLRRALALARPGTAVSDIDGRV